MKTDAEVIQEFNDLVNMTSSELEKWLESSDSNSAGWPKDSGDGESVGHDSGRKIVEILKDNPQKDPDKYDDDQVEHMRKVVAYCKRHLAQESAANGEKSTKELNKTKSYASLKNWGHDILKKQQGKPDDSDKAQAGSKRSRRDGPTGDNKVRKTRRNSSTAKDEKNDEEDEEDEEEADEEQSEEDNEDEEDESEEDGEERKTRSKTGNGTKTQKNGKSQEPKDGDDDDDDDDDDEPKDQSSSKSKNGEPHPGETVSWNWGQGQPKGKVLDVKREKTSITTKRGNEVSRRGSDKDPAVLLDTGKSKAIKLSHELN